METVRIDRGLELNKRRLLGDSTDVSFIVEGQAFSAHRLIVGLHSEYLKVLTSSDLPFNERHVIKIGNICSFSTDFIYYFRNSTEITLKGISRCAFGGILEYIYTGAISITESNVFDLYEATKFLQLQSEDPLASKCIKYMIRQLESGLDLKPALIVKMWSYSESFGCKELLKSVMTYIDTHFEVLIEDNFLAFLGFNEICQILSRPHLCVKSIPYVCNKLANWMSKKCVLESEEDTAMAIELVEKIIAKFPVASKVQINRIFNLPLPEFSTNAIGTICDNCCFLTLWSRDEKDICGIAQYLEERKDYQNFMVLKLNGQQAEVKALKNARSFYQHYGPINVKNGSILDNDSFIFHFGGTKVKARKYLADTLFTEEIYVYEKSSLTWLRMSNLMPRRLLHFKALHANQRLFIFGGFTDEKSSSFTKRTEKVDGLNLSISRSVYCIHIDDWFSSSGKWREIATLPDDLTWFSVVNIDHRSLCVVSNNRLDILDTRTFDWKTIRNRRKLPQVSTSENKPVVAALVGYVVHVICPPIGQEGFNTIWSIDISESEPEWQPLLPSLEMRFTPLSAFAHGQNLFLLGHQPAKNNFLFRFDTLLKTWSTVFENFNGHLAVGGCLLSSSRGLK